MDLSKIISVSGRPGLYEIKTQTRTGVVAISLIDGKRITPNSNSQISILGDIKVYCIGKEISLTKVFEKIIAFESGAKTSVSPKATALELEAYFFEILDNYDEEKVYPSDIKKILKWYNLLLSKKLITLPKLKKTSTKKVKDKKNETSLKK
tara:strand:+ start:436 stop:888 length:453 start_codon:yes stop_codon:yes gene_type:complete